MTKIANFAVVIKTDNYAGDFEREMCAHLTGHIGECEVGEEYVDDDVLAEFDEYVCDEPDDNGCYRPVALGCDIDGFTSNDVVIFFENEPEQKHLDIIQERVKTFKYSNTEIRILGIELVEFIKKTKIKKIC